MLPVRNWKVRRAGFSIIELLVVVVIITILAALLMIAVQAIREVANKVKCANNLKNIGEAFHHYHLVYKHLPSGGWGWGYVGDPDRPQGKDQGGGWVYAILPYLESQNLYDMGKGLTGDAKRMAIAERVKTPVALLNCPSRRSGGPWIHAWGAQYHEVLPINVDKDARGDYAACTGDQNRDEIYWGPSSYADGDNPSYSWPATIETGVVYQRSEVRFTDVVKGHGNVCMVGEKYMDPNRYRSGTSGADNENMYTGYDNDNCRCTYSVPLQDRAGYNDTMRFGSAHRFNTQMLYMDGGVRNVSYQIDPAVWRASGSRQ
jgi:prepilin-type N-terminal cleavage/methylation domain-containing protein